MGGGGATSSGGARLGMCTAQFPGAEQEGWLALCYNAICLVWLTLLYSGERGGLFCTGRYTASCPEQASLAPRTSHILSLCSKILESIKISGCASN